MVIWFREYCLFIPSSWSSSSSSLSSIYRHCHWFGSPKTSRQPSKVVSRWARFSSSFLLSPPISTHLIQSQRRPTSHFLRTENYDRAGNAGLGSVRNSGNRFSVSPQRPRRRRRYSHTSMKLEQECHLRAQFILHAILMGGKYILTCRRKNASVRPCANQGEIDTS